MDYRSGMRLADFDYHLPRELIADRPAEPRERARLLHVPATGDFADRHIADLPQLLRPGDLLVLNDTKVIPARLVGTRGAATVEVTLVRDNGGGLWHAYAKGARRLHPGDRIEFAEGFAADIVEKTPEGEVTLRFRLPPGEMRAARPLDVGRQRGRSRRLPDDVRPRRRRRRRPDRRAALHSGPDGADRGARHRLGDGDPACRRRHLPAGQGG